MFEVRMAYYGVCLIACACVCTNIHVYARTCVWRGRACVSVCVHYVRVCSVTGISLMCVCVCAQCKLSA